MSAECHQFSNLMQKASARNISQRSGTSLGDGDIPFVQRHVAELLPHRCRLSITPAEKRPGLSDGRSVLFTT